MLHNDPIRTWREDVGRRLLKLDFKPLTDAPFRASLDLLITSGGVTASHFSHSPGLTFRDRELARDGNDDLALLMPFGSPIHVEQQGRTFDLKTGEAAMVENNEPGSVGHSSSVHFISIIVPRATLLQAGLTESQVLTKHWHSKCPSLLLLRKYLRVLAQTPLAATPGLQEAAARHVQELLLLSAQEVAGHGSSERLPEPKSWRLELALAYIRAHYRDPEIAVAAAAADQGISVRYLHQILEAGGVQFTNHINELRLIHAHTLLTDPAAAALSVTDIAFDSGFSDISHFNRLFRKRYGTTPGAIRTEARSKPC